MIIIFAQRTIVMFVIATGTSIQFVTDSIPYREIVETARRYIQSLGGFEKFAEWGLVR